MIKQWLSWINISLGGLSIALVVIALIIFIVRPSSIEAPDTIPPKRPPPSGSFALSKQAYDCIGKGGCNLKYAPMTLQIPDLKTQLVYYGRNLRPDAEIENQVLHFGFVNNPTPTSVVTDQNLYLSYERKGNSGQYIFSPNNAETPLWIQGSPFGYSANIKVFMRNEDGSIITEPAANALFGLPEKEAGRGTRAWEIGKWRVDGSLLARQKARWMGQDRFLERHGGEEFKDWQNKHRLDFADDEENTYSVYVGLNDCLMWSEDKWKQVKPGKDSVNCPLLIVRKVDERVMALELWDVGGRGKVPLTLIKTNDAWSPQQVQERFTFLGARTRSQYIFEIDGQRMFISPKDWLLQTDEGWIKLMNAQQIDDYVDRKLNGVLFVVDGLTRKEGQQVLLGTMFNPSRTEMQEIEIPVQQGSTRNHTTIAAQDDPDDDDDDDDEDDEDEEIIVTPTRKDK